MKTNTYTKTEATVTESTVDSSLSTTTVKHYYEMENQTVQEVSDLQQLQNQLEQLQNLHLRSRFMIREIAYLMKVD